MHNLRLSINFCYSLLQLVFVTFMFLISVILRPIVFLILKSRYGKSVRLLKPSDAFLAFEDTSSNVVMAIKCKGIPDTQDIYRKLEEGTFHMPSTLELDGKQSQVPYNPYDCLKWKLVTKYFYFCWEKCPDFNFRNHFIVESFPLVAQNGKHVQEMCPKSSLKTKCDSNYFVKSDLDRSLERVCEYYLEHKFSSEKPGWVIHILVPKNGGENEIKENSKGCAEPGSGGPKEFAMIFCTHHSYGDGMSWIQMLRHVWSDEIFDLKFEPLETPSIFKNRTVLQVILQTCISFGYTLLLPLRLASFMAMSTCESHMFSVDSPNSSRSCSWRGMEMAKIQSVRKHRQGESGRFAKFTTVIYSCVTYAYRQFLLEAGDSTQNSTVIIPKVFSTTTIFADFPYKSLRPTNQSLVTSIPMPVGECCRNERFLAVGDILTKAANIFELKGTSASIQIWGSLITPFLKFIYSMDSLSCSLVVSNLLGPQESFTVLGGHEVLNILGFPPLKVKTSVSLCLVSYRENVDVCVVADDAVTKKFPNFVSRCLQYFDEELENLVRDSLSS